MARFTFFASQNIMNDFCVFCLFKTVCLLVKQAVHLLQYLLFVGFSIQYYKMVNKGGLFMHLSQIFPYKQNTKKGFSLVEVLAAVLILSLVTTTVLLGINFSRNMVTGNTNSDAYAAEAQAAADAIMTYVNGGGIAATAIEEASKVGGVVQYKNASGGFVSTVDGIQFVVEPDPKGSSLYKITVREYYGFANDRQFTEMICFAHKDW